MARKYYFLFSLLIFVSASMFVWFADLLHITPGASEVVNTSTPTTVGALAKTQHVAQAPKAQPVSELPKGNDGRDLPFDPAAIVSQVRHAFKPATVDDKIAKSADAERGEFAWSGSNYEVMVANDTVSLRARVERPIKGETLQPEPLAARELPAVLEPAKTATVRTKPLSLKTTTLKRSGAGGLMTGQAEPADDGSLRIVRSDHVETLRNTTEGLYQMWHFSAKPRGQKALEVAVKVSGLEYVATTSGGLHFAEASKLGFVYGHATWVDARGVRTPIRGKWDKAAQRIRFSVPSHILETSSYPAVLDPLISAEQDVDDPAPQYDSSFNILEYTIAYNGTDYVIGWTDRRNSPVAAEVYASRVSSTGVVLDRYGILLDSGLSTGSPDVGVAAAPTQTLVTWLKSGQVLAKRIDNAGMVLDGTALVVSSAMASGVTDVTAASNGTNFLVAWRDGRNIATNSNDIYGRRVSTAGALLDAADIAIASTTDAELAPAIASNGSDYLVTWLTSNVGTGLDIEGSRVTAAGVVSDSPALAIAVAPGIQRDQKVASDGTDYMVAWQDSREGGAPGSQDSIYAGRVVAATGALPDGTGLVVTNAGGPQIDPAIGYNGTDYLVAWKDPNGAIYDVQATRMTSAGARLDGNGFLVNADGDNDAVVVADGATSALVVSHLDQGAFGRRVMGNTIVDERSRPLTAGSNEQAWPDMAFDGTNYLVVWVDQRNRHASGNDIYGARVNADGSVVLDPTGFLINTTPKTLDSGDHDNQVRVASNGSNFLVTWYDDSYQKVLSRRVSTAGALLDVTAIYAGLNINGTQSEEGPRVASDGTDYLLAWTDYRTGGNNGDIYFNRISSAGAVLDGTGVALAATTNYEAVGEIAYGMDYVLGWGEGSRAAAARVSSAGAILDPGGVTIDSAMGFKSDVDPIWNGTEYMFFYTNYDTRGVQRARRMSSALVGIGSAFDVHSDTLQQSWSTSAYGGNYYMVLFWQENGALWDLVGKRFSDTGVALDATPFTVLTDHSGDDYYPLVSPVADTFLLGYQRDISDDTKRIHSSRLRTVKLTWSAQGASCSADHECESGFCSDGVCCASDCGNALDDCRACSVAAGGNTDGLCTALTAAAAPGVTCRAAQSVCDIAEVCMAGNQACPSEVVAMAGITCNAQVGVCDVAEVCDGINPTCPADAVRPNTHMCGSASCTGGVETAAVNCNGTDKTCPSGMMTNCSPYICGASACLSSCVDDDDCASSAYCAAGSCVAKLANGTACSTGTQCTSGICADGVCCDGACTAQCEACNVSGSLGTCSPVTGTPVTGRTPCAGTGTCGGSCDGSNRTACAYPDMTVVCRMGSCTGGTATLEATCDGAGACPAVQMQDCAPNTCAGNICGGGCTTDGQCASGNYCSGGVCVPTLANGSSCSGDTQCTSGFCTDGVCCNLECSGQCEACNSAGTVGTCIAVMGAPVGGRTPCAGMIGDTCTGSCDGVVGNSCTFPSTSVECSAADCRSDTQFEAAFCDGAGACNMPMETACGFGCAGVVCAECVLDTDCTDPQTRCVSGVCMMRIGGDAGPGDAGPDGGDAGMEDAGNDAGDDAGDSDGGHRDSGRRDAGRADGGELALTGGSCSCRVSQPTRAPLWPFGLLVLGLVRRRHRHKRIASTRS